MADIFVTIGQDVSAAYASAVSGDSLHVSVGAVWPMAPAIPTFFLTKSNVNFIGVPDSDGTLPETGTSVIRFSTNVRNITFANFRRAERLMVSSAIVRNITIENIVFGGFSQDHAIFFVGNALCANVVIRKVTVLPNTASKKALRFENFANLLLEDCVIDGRHPAPIATPVCVYLNNVDNVMLRRVHGANSYFASGTYFQGDIFDIEASCSRVILEDCSGYGALDGVVDCKAPDTIFRRCVFGDAKRVLRLWYGGIIQEFVHVYNVHSTGDGQSISGVWSNTQAGQDAIQGKELISFSDVVPLFGIG